MDKRIYSPPQIEEIKLDNEISLVLESNPPFPGNENISSAPEHLSNDPFKTNIS
jgi:hypothetical protein